MPTRVGELHTAIHPELERRLVIKRDNRHEVIVLASLTPQPSGKRVSVIRRNATAHSALRITQDMKALYVVVFPCQARRWLETKTTQPVITCQRRSDERAFY
jgi:hypothetical protein